MPGLLMRRVRVDVHRRAGLNDLTLVIRNVLVTLSTVRLMFHLANANSGNVFVMLTLMQMLLQFGHTFDWRYWVR
jgi:hypothetical protein